jgi:hypothetical protein
MALKFPFHSACCTWQARHLAQALASPRAIAIVGLMTRSYASAGQTGVVLAYNPQKARSFVFLVLWSGDGFCVRCSAA